MAAENRLFSSEVNLSDFVWNYFLGDSFYLFPNSCIYNNYSNVCSLYVSLKSYSILKSKNGYFASRFIFFFFSFYSTLNFWFLFFLASLYVSDPKTGSKIGYKLN